MNRKMRRFPESGIYIVLPALCALFCYVFCWQYGVFGSRVDWISQHSVLPDYFRQQFYDTGELFPEFAPNIGGGQNIYHFSYYGLYSPLILPAYLLPFVKMSDYMMAVQFLCLAASVLLMYHWLGKGGYSRSVCLGVSCMFLLSGPMIYHSYNQIMFVNYMPFLLLGLMGVDRYFADRSKYRIGLLTVSIFLMIMTSFYFSIGGMLALVIYGLHCWLNGRSGPVLRQKRRSALVSFLRESWRFLVPFLLAVMMSAVLLLPTALTLRGRQEAVPGVDVADLLLPEIRIGCFLYSSYGIGLSSLGMTALIAGIFWGCGSHSREIREGTAGKWRKRVLPVCCGVVLSVPIFAWLLNGGLYIRDKVMIPFLPLMCYLMAEYLEQWESRAYTGRRQRELRQKSGRWQGELHWKPGRWLRCHGGVLLPGLCTLLLIYWNRNQSIVKDYWELLMADGLVMLACCGICELSGGSALSRRIPRLGKASWRTVILWLSAVLCLIVFQSHYHTYMDSMVRGDFYRDVTDERIKTLVAETLEQEQGFYRMEQLGSSTENAANLNRIWDMDQYSSSCYSSSYNEGYRTFREQDFMLEQPFRNYLMQSASRNPVWQRLMGVKYVVSREPVSGYELMTQGEGWNIYVNDRVLPVAYATHRFLSAEDYEALEFPHNQLALLEGAVVEDIEGEESVSGKSAAEHVVSGEGIGKTQIEPLSADLSVAQESNGWIQKKDMGYHIRTEQCRSVFLDIPVEEGSENRILFLQFQIRNLKNADVSVWLEDVQNKLTAGGHIYYNGNSVFTYAVLLEEGQEQAELCFGRGEYEISEPSCFLGSLPSCSAGTTDLSLYESSLCLDRERTQGNLIAGSIQVEQPGYFVTSIPYDEGFEIRIDGEPVVCERVNLAFLGCKIEAGTHAVKIIYHAPGAGVGKLLSLFGVILFAGIQVVNKILKSF